MPFTELPALQHVNWNPGRGERARSAIAMIVGFGIMGSVSAMRAGAVGRAPMGMWLAGLFLAALLLTPVAGPRVHVGISVASGLMGAVMSRVVLALMFALVFVPLGCILRLGGKDLLGRKSGGTTWHRRDPQPNVERYYQQF